MTGPEQPGPDEELAALAREIERMGRAVAGLTARTDQTDAKAGALDRDLADLARTVAGLIRPAPGPPSGSWLDPQPGGPSARQILDDLIVWLGRVYLRYDGSGLPSCWMWHADVIEELVWLRRAHHEAQVAKTGPAEKLGAWHEKSRPGVVKRIRDTAGACELSQHCPYAERAYSGDINAPLTDYIAAVAMAWQHREAPEPTHAMLAAASLHDRPQRTAS